MKKKVLVTRSLEQAPAFAKLLEEFGFEPVVFPAIEFAPPEDKSFFTGIASNISSYNWLILTSANGVRFLVRALKEAGISAAGLKGIKVCAIGPRTAEVAEEVGIKVDLMPGRYQSEGVLEEFERIDLKGKRILFPRANEGRNILPDGLRGMGAIVDLLPVYKGVKPEGKDRALRKVLDGGIDILTFTSGATVRNFLNMLGEKNRNLIKDAKVACLSEVTAAAARDLGLKTDIFAAENTARSLAEAIKRYCE